MTNTNGTQPTSGREWRRVRQEGEVIRLPSGNYARVRPVALDRLILSGQLPDVLTPIAAKSLWVGEETTTIAEQAELARGYAELVNLIVPAAILAPRIVDDPHAEDEISLDDLDFDDKLAIFQLATAPADALRRFRLKQEADVEPVSDGKDDGQPAQ